MTKRFLAILFLVALIIPAFGNPIDKKQAERVAKNFYYERANQSGGLAYDDISITGTFTREEAGQVVYYIFNINNSGFVIVSGDDLIIPVIGYSVEGIYNSDNEPVQFTDWMNNAKEQVVYHRNRQTAKTEKIISEWERLNVSQPDGLLQLKGTKSVEPLLVSTWDQGGFYNDLCPEDAAGPGGHVWAGCVATAMAQVMFYYRFPETGVGSHGYTSDYGYLSANFGATTYKWDEMLTSVHSYNLAVATLLYHCGVAVNMGYSPSGSGAYSGTAASALVNYFRYSPNTHMEDKDNYTDADWADLLRNQLDAKRPMYYHGFGSGGHAFNVDGYQEGDYFHFNWGWSGSYNGYFYLDNLNPGGSDFTQGQGAMVNIYPTGNYPSFCTGSKTYTGQAGTIDDGSAPSLYQADADCYFLINPQASPDDSISKIKMQFNRFDTESDHDFLTIYDGPTSNSPVIGTFSGSNLPGTFYSSGNQVLLHFTSDGSNHHDGFLMTYESVFPDYCDGIVAYRGQSGVIEDGSGSKHYNNKCVCQYLIQPSVAGKVTLIFNQFQTEPTNDFLEVYAYDTVIQNGTLLGHFSGNSLPPTLISNTGAMFLIFYTNPSVNGDGWQGTYTVTPVGISENDSKETISIYPNPAHQSFNLVIQREKAASIMMEIIDITGRTVIKQDLGLISGSVTKTIDTSDFSTGSYFVRLISPTGVNVSKLMVE